tara:strand:- start:539 stop:841 length:303 start_codon:yes stop_codon:yes gene_type:complete
MKFKKYIFFILIFFLFSGCQTIKEKSDAVAEKENQKYGKFVGKGLNELIIELGNPSEDFISETGNKNFVYKSKKFGISCERKFEVNEKNVITSFTSSGCI